MTNSPIEPEVARCTDLLGDCKRRLDAAWIKWGQAKGRRAEDAAMAEIKAIAVELEAACSPSVPVSDGANVNQSL